jgi:hypothetical protein
MQQADKARDQNDDPNSAHSHTRHSPEDDKQCNARCETKTEPNPIHHRFPL